MAQNTIQSSNVYAALLTMNVCVRCLPWCRMTPWFLCLALSLSYHLLADKKTNTSQNEQQKKSVQTTCLYTAFKKGLREIN